MRFAGLLTPSFGPRSPAFAAMIEGTSGEDWYMPVIPTKPLRIALFIAYGNLCGEQYGVSPIEAALYGVTKGHTMAGMESCLS